MNDRRLFYTVQRVAWMLLSGILLAGYVQPAYGQIYRLPGADTSRGRSFGVTVALDGNLALVGASGEAVCGQNAGAVYVFARDSTGRWRETARLTPSDCRTGAFFGRALALSGDRALIGASTEFFADEKPSVAYIFERDAAGTWHETARLTAGPRRSAGVFAASVALDGGRALITTRTELGAPRGGAAYIFERAPAGTWLRTARLTAGRLPEGSTFGGAGALDGGYAVVAASSYLTDRPGALYIFERDTTGHWHRARRLTGIDDAFVSLALDGRRLLVGEARGGRREAGVATLFTRNAAGRWQQTATLHPGTPYAHGAFGMAVALDGRTALVTGYDEQLGLDTNIDRVVYVFEHARGSSRWHQRQVIDVGTVDFATSIALDEGTALIGYVPPDGPGGAFVVRLR